MSDLIKAEGLTKVYHSGSAELEVLKGVHITIAAGELVAIHGPSGVGKSTLLHILGTLDRPTSGTVWFAGTAVNDLREKMLSRLRNRHIGFIFQFYHLLPEFTALENVLLPAMVNGCRLKSARTRAKELLDSVGLSQRETHKPDALSGGEQQRVAIARALINSPDIVFADEPTGNLDERTSGEIFDLIRRLNAESGTTFVIVTHETALARSAGRSLRLMEGRLEEWTAA